MARLNWQNVDNPNFSGVADSYRVMSDLLGRATASGSGMVDTFTKARSDAADRAILQRMLGVRDPSQFNPQDIIGGQGQYASMAALENVGKYEDTLIDRGVTRDTHAQNRIGWDRTNQGNAQLDSNAASINAALADAAAGKPGATERLAALNLRPDVTAKLLETSNSTIDSRLGQNRNIQSYDITGYNQDRTERDDQFGDSAPADAEYLYQQGFGTGNATLDEQIINKSGWDERRKARARALVGAGGTATGTGAAAPATAAIRNSVGTPAGTIAGGRDPSRIMNYEARDSGFNSVPDTVRTLGQASDFAVQVNGANKARTGSPGSSAMGTYQITGETLRDFGPRVFGEGWENTDFTPENQDKIAEAIFNASNGSAKSLSNRWVSLSTEEAERVRKMPWSEARQVIAQKESGAGADYFAGGGQQPVANESGMPNFLLPNQATPARFADPNADAIFDVVRSNTAANSGSLNDRLAVLEDEPEQPLGVLVKGLQDNGYQGYAAGELSDQIRALAAKHKIKNTQAALILSERLTDRNLGMTLLDKSLDTANQVPILNWFVPDSTIAENTYDEDQLEAAGTDYAESGQESVDLNRQRVKAVTELATAEQKVEQIRATLQQTEQRYQATQSPAVLAQVRSLQAQMASAQLVRENLQKEISQMQDFTTSDLAAPGRRAAEQAQAAYARSPEGQRVSKAVQDRMRQLMLERALDAL